MSAVGDDTVTGYAAEVARLLWPEPWGAPRTTIRHRRPGTGVRGLYVFPAPRRPRLLLPAEVNASASMLQRLGKGRSRRSRVARALLVRSVGSRAFSLLPWPMLRMTHPGHAAPESIESYLATNLGVEVRVGVILGTRRANQKPVLQIFALDGRLVGYAKIGHNEITAPLVRCEAETLSALGPRRTIAFRAPQLLHHGRWRTLEVLVMSALTGTPGLYAPDTQRIAAMREVAQLCGTVQRPLADSGFWRRLRAQTDEVRDDVVRRRLTACLVALQARWGETDLRFGSWHGDWGHWNMAVAGDLLQVWDWERFDHDVPIGFDGLHHAAQRVRPADRDVRQQEETFLRSAPAVLAAFDVVPGHRALTVALYLLEVSVRYALAMNHDVAAPLQARSSWAVALLEEQLATHTTLDHSGGRRP